MTPVVRNIQVCNFMHEKQKKQKRFAVCIYKLSRWDYFYTNAGINGCPGNCSPENCPPRPEKLPFGKLSSRKFPQVLCK